MHCVQRIERRTWRTELATAGCVNPHSRARLNLHSWCKASLLCVHVEPSQWRWTLQQLEAMPFAARCKQGRLSQQQPRRGRSLTATSRSTFRYHQTAHRPVQGAQMPGRRHPPPLHLPARVHPATLLALACRGTAGTSLAGAWRPNAARSDRCMRAFPLPCWQPLDVPQPHGHKRSSCHQAQSICDQGACPHC